MKKLVSLLSLILLFHVQTPALSLPQSDIPVSDDCAKLGRACAAAARELAAARKLIAGYEEHIIAADLRIEVARQELATLKEIGALEKQRAAELQAVIEAERAGKAVLLEKISLQEKRIAKLDGQAKRARKFALIAGVAAGVAMLITAVQR